MEIFDSYNKTDFNVCLILGFFDGIHIGHKSVVESAINYAKKQGVKTALLTFKASPAQVLTGNSEYIYPRQKSYELLAELGVDLLYEIDFSEIMNVSAEEYLQMIVEHFSPISISTGYNYTFGKSKSGNCELLEKNQDRYGYKYFRTPQVKYNGAEVCSTNIKNALKNADLEFVNNTLTAPYSITSKVISGRKLGRELGFPTANMLYPKNMVKIPYGVYKARVKVGLFEHDAMLNWGIKPTVSGKEELLELHILNFNEDLYGSELSFNIIKKVRDEKKFENLELLKTQIQKDVEICSKL